jgi:hypothetical protein
MCQTDQVVHDLQTLGMAEVPADLCADFAQLDIAFQHIAQQAHQFCTVGGSELAGEEFAYVAKFTVRRFAVGFHHGGGEHHQTDGQIAGSCGALYC